MSSQAITRLREVRDLLASFDGPSSIHRAAELTGAADKVASCARDLADVEEPHDLGHQLASVAESIQAAEKAARTHHLNPLTRPLSRTRFALKTGVAGGRLQGVLETMDPANTPPSPSSD